MTQEKTCYCTKKTLRFSSSFDVDTVTQLYCPACIDRAADDVLVFEMCEPSLYAGYWGIRYNDGILKEIDPAFRHASDYYLSLLISGHVAPEMVVSYGEGGLCRVIGFKHTPEEITEGADLIGGEAALHERGGDLNWPGDVDAGPMEVRRGRLGST